MGVGFRMARRFLFALGLVSTLLLTPEEALPGESEPQAFSSQVSLVSIPVFVVNSKREGWAGLTRGDFELFDDGKPVPIVAFQYIDATSTEDQRAIRDVPAARRHFLFLFDLSFTSQDGLRRARVAAQDFVRTGLQDADLGAVATFDVHRGVRLVANFSDDRYLMIHAIETLGVPSITKIRDPLALAENLEQADVQLRSSGTDEVAAQTFLRALAVALRNVDERAYQEEVMTLNRSLEQLGKSLVEVEGRKQILFFSAGFEPQGLVGTVSPSAMRADGEAITRGRLAELSEERFGDSNMRQVFAKMAKSLSASDSVLHAIDVTGLGGGVQDAKESRAPRDPERNDNGSESLGLLASETGGRFFGNSNDLHQALVEVGGMTNRYYVLGYQPDDLHGPGHFHKLKVRVRRDGAKVSYRAGFVEKAPLHVQEALEKKFSVAQLLMTGVGPTNTHLSALCLPFPARGGEKATLGVVLQVPKEDLPWGRELPVEVYGYAVGDDGAVVDHLAEFARIKPSDVDPGNAAAGLSFYGTFALIPAHYTLKFLFLVQETDSVGVQLLDVTVPPREPQAGFLLPPVLLDAPSRWISLDLGRSAERPSFPLSAGGKALVPRASFEIVPGAPERLALVAFEPEGPSDPVSGVEIQSSIVDGSGRAAPGGPMRITEVDRGLSGHRTFLLDYSPGTLAPGSYTLRVGLGDSRGRRLESYSLLKVPNSKR